MSAFVALYLINGDLKMKNYIVSYVVKVSVSASDPAAAIEKAVKAVKNPVSCEWTMIDSETCKDTKTGKVFYND